ncbi:XdhC family protein [Actinomadura decatromicini]|uniref:XdhC Rossmann domain-containing protein n=1 Tax=Actinomadura decatromicini TaxID=2604572 RepID=A0A5D3F8U9_9ACTN|nr:XdhC family protein [Actinomadura decatromicini]TYK44110.1 hypothetical protein FXF68_35975 [Actinomadura decatromicini]
MTAGDPHMLREIWPFVDAVVRDGGDVVLARLVGRDGPGARPLGAVCPHRWSIGPDPGDADPLTFTEFVRPRRRLVLVGATDLAAALAGFAGTLHRETVIVDPRKRHLSSGAFPSDAALVRAWPGEWLDTHPLDPCDALVTVSHDQRIDDDALRTALAGKAGYVAALGSRATHAERLERLSGAMGLERLIGPVGLDLGGVTSTETALSILAELVAVDNGRQGGRLRRGRQPIHALSGCSIG